MQWKIGCATWDMIHEYPAATCSSRKLLSKGKRARVRRAGERLAGEAVTASEENGDLSLYRVRARPGPLASRLAVMSAIALVAERRGTELAGLPAKTTA